MRITTYHSDGTNSAHCEFYIGTRRSSLFARILEEQVSGNGGSTGVGGHLECRGAALAWSRAVGCPVIGAISNRSGGCWGVSGGWCN